MEYQNNVSVEAISNLNFQNGIWRLMKKLTAVMTQSVSFGAQSACLLQLVSGSRGVKVASPSNDRALANGAGLLTI